MLNQKKFNENIIVLICIFTMPLTGFGLDIYSPALPAMTTYFSSSKDIVQSSISIYLLGLGLIQLLVGGFLDCIGRRSPYILGALFYTIFTLALITTTNINIFLICRLMQGIAMGAMHLSARAVMFDSAKDTVKVANYGSITYALGPIVAPVLGGYLQHYFGWHASLWFLFIYTIIIVSLFIRFIPETLVNKRQLNLHEFLVGYKVVLSSTKFWYGAICLGLVYSNLVIFNIASPFLVEVTLKYSEIISGYIGLLMGIGWLVGGVINRILIAIIPHDISGKIKCKYSLIAALIMSLLMLLFSFITLNLYVLIIPMFFITMCGAIILPIYFSMNIRLFPKFSGTFGALTGAMLFIISAFATVTGSVLKFKNQVPLSFLIFIIVISIFLFNQVLFNNKNKVYN